MHMASEEDIAWRMDTGIGLHWPILSVIGEEVSVHQMAQYSANRRRRAVSLSRTLISTYTIVLFLPSRFHPQN